jgi:DNA-binding MarR family transcriptional regulator
MANDTFTHRNRSHPVMKPRTLVKADFEQLAEFRYQLRRFLRFSEDISHRNGITMTQYLLLLQIAGYPGRDRATISELAERLQAKHHGVVSLVSRCEALGLVARRENADDKRRVEVELTREGQQTVARLAQLHRDELTSLQGEFIVPVPTFRKQT